MGLVHHLPVFLGPLIGYLADERREIRAAAQQAQQDLLDQVRELGPGVTGLATVTDLLVQRGALAWSVRCECRGGWIEQATCKLVSVRG